MAWSDAVITIREIFKRLNFKHWSEIRHWNTLLTTSCTYLHVFEM